MPKIVDHDRQRVKFAEAAMSLIARHGLEGVTMRAVAAEAGLSYGSLFHYFHSQGRTANARCPSLDLASDQADQ